jgi:hypothetical protein
MNSKQKPVAIVTGVPGGIGLGKNIRVDGGSMPVGNNSTVAEPGSPGSRLRELGVVLPTRGSGSPEVT